MELKIGILGAGAMGATHARHWARVPGVRVSAVADLDLSKATKVADSVGATPLGSAEELFDAGCDVLSVCTPTDTHCELTERALAAGCHVLCEKPMALSVADCDAMILAAKRAGKLLSVGQVVRFFPEYANAKNLVDAGEVGNPAVVRARRGGGFPAWSDWFADTRRSGGILFDLGVHEFDWLLWCFGPIERVYAKALTPKLEAGELTKLDMALVTLRHASGCVSHVEATWADPKGGGTRFEIAGDAGLLVHDSRSLPTLSFRTETRSGNASALHEGDDPYFRQCLAFARAIRGEAPLAVTAEDGRAAIAVAVAADASLRSGRAVTLERK